MGLYHQFQAAVTFMNLIPFIQIHVHKLGTIMQSLCWGGFDEGHFLKGNWYLK